MLTVDVSPVDMGVVKLFDTEAEFYPTSAPIFESEVILEAVPVPGYQFNGWTGDVTSEDNPLTLVMDCSKFITANFSLVKHTLVVTTSGNGSTEPAVGFHEYILGSLVDVIAIPDINWQFDGWTGDVTDPTSATTTIIMDSDMTVTADFSPIVHTLTMGTDGSGSTEPAVGPDEYPQGSIVDIAATPGRGWKFDSWAGGVADPASAVTTVTVATDMEVTALFRRSWLLWWLVGGGIIVLATAIFVRIAVRRSRARDNSAT